MCVCVCVCVCACVRACVCVCVYRNDSENESNAVHLTVADVIVGTMCLIDEVQERVFSCSGSQCFLIQQPQNATRLGVAAVLTGRTKLHVTTDNTPVYTHTPV